MTTDSALRRQLFVTLGLSDKEALLYDTLLTHGPQGSGVLEKLSHLKKNTYSLLRSLERRQLVSVSYVEGKKVFIPAPPDQLLLSIKEQKRALAHTQALLEAALPELTHAYQTRVGSPTVRHYQGKTGLREVLEQTYQAGKKEIYGCVGWISPTKTLDEASSHYSQLRVERGIYTYAINNDNEAGREFARRATNPDNLAEVKLINQTNYPLPAEIDVWNNTIAFLSFENKDFQGVMIEHPQFAQTLNSIFKLLFDLLRQNKAESPALKQKASRPGQFAKPKHPAHHSDQSQSNDD